MELYIHYWNKSQDVIVPGMVIKFILSYSSYDKCKKGLNSSS